MYDELVKRLRMQAEVERFFTGEPMLYEQAADAIEELTEERKTGKWKWRSFNIQCPLCEFEPLFDSTEPLYNYCPNCGTRMVTDDV